MKFGLLAAFLAIALCQIECKDKDKSDENVDEQMDMNVYLNCTKKYNIRTDKLEEGSRDEKCNNACAMKAKGMMTYNGELVKDRIMEELFKNETAENFLKLQSVLETCLTEVSKEKDECEVTDRLITCAKTKSVDSAHAS